MSEEDHPEKPTLDNNLLSNPPSPPSPSSPPALALLVESLADTKRQRLSPAIRHAEKRRTAHTSCPLANRIAACSVEKYRAVVPLEHQRPSQTCLATIVCLDKDKNELTVVALGVGTKFLSEAVLASEQARWPRNDEGTGTFTLGRYGERVRDCHAEVLARRAFRRFLSLQIIHLMDSDSSTTIIKTQMQESESNNQLNVPIILEKMAPAADTLATRSCNFPDQADCNHRKALSSLSRCFRLRPSISLHFYCSSSPCGNSVLKKFAHSKPLTNVGEHQLPNHQWPLDRHEAILAHAVPDGQFSLLLKRDPTVTASDTTMNASLEARKILSKKEFEWPCHRSDTWCPPGTANVMSCQGSMHTCSDKMARWNCLGLQGSLLMSVLAEPLYMSTLTVGRKLSHATCRRAVCCRIGCDNRCSDVGISVEQKLSKSEQSAKNNESSSAPLRQRTRRNAWDHRGEVERVFESSGYRVNHPAIMGTNVYLDETGVIDTGLHDENIDSRKQHVRFDSKLSWAWWPEGCEEYGLECIDGSAGYRLLFEVKRSDDNNNNEHCCCGSYSVQENSRLSTTSLVDLVIQIHSIQAVGVSPSTSMYDHMSHCQTLAELEKMKWTFAREYEEKKHLLMTQHAVLKYWRRRSRTNSHKK